MAKNDLISYAEACLRENSTRGFNDAKLKVASGPAYSQCWTQSLAITFHKGSGAILLTHLTVFKQRHQINKQFDTVQFLPHTIMNSFWHLNVKCYNPLASLQKMASNAMLTSHLRHGVIISLNCYWPFGMGLVCFAAKKDDFVSPKHGSICCFPHLVDRFVRADVLLDDCHCVAQFLPCLASTNALSV